MFTFMLLLAALLLLHVSDVPGMSDNDVPAVVAITSASVPGVSTVVQVQSNDCNR